MILVVEDSSTQRMLLRRELDAGGWRRHVGVASAAEALAFLRSDEPPMHDAPDGAPSCPVDLVLLDNGLPDGEGVDVCRRLRASPAHRDLPILMITAADDEATLERAFAAGATDYLSKPFGAVELRARVGNLLRLKRETDRRVARETQLLEVTSDLGRANEALRAQEAELLAAGRELERANGRLEALSLEDPLTGLANRRRFDASFDLEWRRALRTGEPLALVLLDLDAFKAYNDRYGHPAGDRCLRRVADALRTGAQRAGDVVARYGGEEFALLLPATDLAGAQRVAEGVRAGVAALALEHADAPRGLVSASFGVAACAPQVEGGGASLLARADEALYRAKRCGRDRVELFTGPELSGPEPSAGAIGPS